jgi:hypothetical protein
VSWRLSDWWSCLGGKRCRPQEYCPAGSTSQRHCTCLQVKHQMGKASTGPRGIAHSATSSSRTLASHADGRTLADHAGTLVDSDTCVIARNVQQHRAHAFMCGTSGSDGCQKSPCGHSLTNSWASKPYPGRTQRQSLCDVQPLAVPGVVRPSLLHGLHCSSALSRPSL